MFSNKRKRKAKIESRMKKIRDKGDT